MIVVEGYMDVIALAQAGIGEAVAPLGTALTDHQIARLWRMADTPVLCFDGDAAGQKAAVRAIARALPGLEPARSLQFVTLPQGQDPDDLIRSGGRAAIDALLKAPEPLFERLWRHELEAEPLATPEARAGLRQRVISLVQTIENTSVREQYLAEFRSRFDAQFARTAAPNRFRAASRFPIERPPGGQARSISGSGIEPFYARAILAGLLRHPAMIHACAEAVARLPFADDEQSRLRDTLLDAAFDQPELESASLITICETAGFAGLARQLANANMLAFSFTQRQADAELARRDLGMAIEALAARPELDAALEAATARLAEEWDETGFAEQQRLREARREADDKLAALRDGADD